MNCTSIGNIGLDLFVSIQLKSTSALSPPSCITECLYMWRTLTLSGKHTYYLSDRFYYISTQGSIFKISRIFCFNFWLCWIFVAAQAFSSCGEQGLLSSCGEQGLFSSCGDRLLTAVVSTIAEHGLLNCGLTSCGLGTQQLHNVGSSRTRNFLPKCIARADS